MIEAALGTYDTNVWGNCRWLMVYNWRPQGGIYVPDNRWQWNPVEKLPKWFRHKARQGVFQGQLRYGILSFVSTARYQIKDKLSPQLSNLCGDFDAESDDDFLKITKSMAFTINHFMGLNISDEYIRIWFSGGRSFHFEIPYQVFGIEPTVELNRHWRFIVGQLNESLPNGCYPFDLNMYSNPRMFRLPNSYYPRYDAYKIELAHDEIHLPIPEIREMARSPQDALYFEASYPEYAPVWKAVDWYQEQVEAQKELEADREEIPIDPLAIKAMVDVPVCIQDLRSNGPKLKDTRNKCQILDATYSLHSSKSSAEAIAAIDLWTDRMVGDERKQKERRASTRSAVTTIYATPNTYKFACGYAWHLKLNCVGEACPLYQKHDLRKHSERVQVVENVDWNPSEIKAVSVSEAREQMSDHFSDYLIDWWRDPTKDIIAYTLPPGSGKTVTPFKALEAGLVEHTLYFAPSHAILNEREEEFPHFFHVRARSFVDENFPPDEQLCIKPNVCNAYAAKRYNAVKSVCLTKCEKCFNCKYRRQFVPRDTVLTHEYLFSPTFMDGLTTGEGGIEGPHSWGVIVDEPSIGTFIETVNITNSTLTKAINRADSEPFRKLLEVVRNTIETACNGGQKPVHIVGQTAFDLVMDTAKKASYDLPELVAGAREVVDQDKAPHVRVEFEVMIDISKNGKSILMRIDGNEIWLPVSEIELDEAAKTVTMPKWLAAKHNLSESIPLDEIDVAAEVEESKSELLLNFADDLVACLEADLKKKAPFNSSLVITKIAKSPTLRLNLKRSFNHVTGPVVMLDAFAEPELLSALTGRKVKQWRVPLKMASDEVIQVIDGQYGITTLWNKSENAPKKAVMRLMKAVNRITTGKESETLIVTWKALAQYLIALQQQGEFDSRAAIAWYGAIEGINTYEDRTQAILIGTPSPQKDDIIEMGQAIWANDPKLLNTEVRQVWRRYAYKDANGNGKEAKIWEFEDERLNMILRTYREYEMIQAAHRIRPLLTAGKLIYLLSSLPIEELPPTRLTTLNELAGDAKPEGYDEFVVLVETLVNRYTGVWHGVFEMAKSSNLTLVINNISYNSAQIAKFLQMLSRDKCFRWLPKVAKQLGLVSTRLVFTKGLSLKVFYRSGQLDENKIRELYFRVFGQKS